VFGSLADKDWAEMLDVLAPLFAARIYVAPPNCDKGARAAAEPSRMAQRHPGEVARDVEHALARARELAGPKAAVVVAGSIFLVGEARARLLGMPRDPAVAL
jgi:dihydrofolate synthase / folylpolyglutamate synthase